MNQEPVMPAPRPVQQQLHGVLEPIVREAGFDLDDVDVRVAGRRHTVKVVIDSDAGVGLDDIARLSRLVSTELDQHEHMIGGSYTLEVTSPGAERPLTQPRHWRRARLRKVVVRPVSGAEFSGRVGDAGEEAVTLLVEGKRREVRYADVTKASVEVEFRPPPESEVAALGGAEPYQRGKLAEEPS
jgi:ribosome maturation factor RimP